jgi:hypothetical protein
MIPIAGFPAYPIFFFIFFYKVTGNPLYSDDLKIDLFFVNPANLFQGMTTIGSNIFCQTNVLVSAVTNAKSVPTLCRRMFIGVFKEEQIQDCTVTGQSWHAGGQDRMKQKKTPLHEAALKAIFGMS